ncbi:MAG TPA: Uma2 family endonuclease [Pirellulales bacterium]|jgi:Uma2 family endonuclease|nr:Uma2 family endonuclease [Pirellulales bacterium]
MATLVTDPFVEQQILAERAELGTDRYDEVWEGTYMMTPLPNLEHQRLVMRLAAILENSIGQTGLGDVFPGANVSDREEGWKQNFRGPEVVVLLKGGRAKDCDTHLCGGPDFLIEITSPHDHSREKLVFYGKIGVRELMLIDREPWSLELYQLKDGELRLAGKSRLDESAVLTSAVVPLSFRLIPGKSRPQIEVTHRDGKQRWIV